MRPRLAMVVWTTCVVLAAQADATAYEVVDVPDGGTVAGHVRYDGKAPARAKIKITKNTTQCGQEARLSEALIVADDGGIANAVVRLTGITKGVDFPEVNPTLDQRACQFRPHVLAFSAGEMLSVLNSDGILHNVHTYSQVNPPVNKAQPGFKKQIQLKFDKAEFPIRVECDAHGWMKAWLVVEEHPYYAVTDESGAFLLRDVPPGDYALEVWQETLGRKTMPVSVKAGTESAVTVSFSAQ